MATLPREYAPTHGAVDEAIDGRLPVVIRPAARDLDELAPEKPTAEGRVGDLRLVARLRLVQAQMGLHDQREILQAGDLVGAVDRAGLGGAGPLAG